MRFRLFASALALLTLLTACQQNPDNSGSETVSLAESSSTVSVVESSSTSSSQPESSAPEAESASSSEAEVPVATPAPSQPVSSAASSQAVTSEPPIVSQPKDPLLVLSERADETSVLMELEQETYPVDAKEITVLVINGSEQEVTGDMYFVLEKQEDNQWKKVRFKDDTAFPDIAEIIRPGGSTDQSISLKQFAQPLTSGLYRVSKQFGAGERPFTLTAEFNLGAPEGQLELKKPNSIKLSIGSEGKTVKAALTRKQRYEGVSEVTFVMDLLEDFVPLADNQKVIVAEGSEGALLTLTYSDGLQRDLLIDPLGSIEREDGSLQPVTRLLDGQQWYYCENTEIYSRLFACASALGEQVN